jgi:hypothetical protein
MANRPGNPAEPGFDYSEKKETTSKEKAPLSEAFFVGFNHSSRVIAIHFLPRGFFLAFEEKKPGSPVLLTNELRNNFS